MINPKYDGQRWRIQKQVDGKRFSFSSKTPGQKGRREVIAKYEAWFYGEASGEKTVNQVAKEYLDDIKNRCGIHSAAFELYERYIRLYIAPKCGQRKICKMTQKEWQNVINTATGQNKPLSEKTLKSLKAIIMALIKFGYQDFQCELLRGSLYIPKGHSKKEKEILHDDEIQRLLQPSELFYHPLFCFLLVTGLRPSEALGIQKADISAAYDRLYIKRAVNSRGFITEGKNANAKRLIPIGDYARSILKSTIERNERLNLHTEWVFCSPDGSKGNQSTMRNQWAILKRDRKLSGTVYSLRHTFISILKNTMPEQMLRDIVGHSASMPTFMVYGHFLDSEHIEAAKIIDLTFKEAESKTW